MTILILSASVVLAVPFSVDPLRLSAPANLQYDFTGEELAIPLTVAGTPALTVFFVYTSGKGPQIGKVRNGYLGWHWVNSIDTCVFMSAPKEFSIGSNDYIRWNGRDFDGGLVPADTYTYYVWGYDSLTERKPVCNSMTMTYYYCFMEQYDASGAAIDNPMFFPCPASVANNTGIANSIVRAKWTIGNDPLDSSLMQTTYYTIPAGGQDVSAYCPVPGDHSKFFIHSCVTGVCKYLMKLTWNPNGRAEQDLTFGTDGFYQFGHGLYVQGTPASDDIDQLWNLNVAHRHKRSDADDMYYVDYTDGSPQRIYDFSSHFQNDEEYAKASAAGLTVQQGPQFLFYIHGTGRCILASDNHCLVEMINPYNEVDEDVPVWDNGNGDGSRDRNFASDAGAAAWLCQAAASPARVFDISADQNMFFPADQYDLGTVSFCAFGPDGRGMGTFAFIGETAGYNKLPIYHIDNGGSYDGMYCGWNRDTPGMGWAQGLWWVGQDSIKGTISNVPVGVAGSKPSSFSVAQNVPNPFNPTTTISFSLAKAGNVTVDVFNSAGQKVDTLVNRSMNTGSHSITWNASKFSAGVYFCTVKSGEFSKTVKMTLLK